MKCVSPWRCWGSPQADTTLQLTPWGSERKLGEAEGVWDQRQGAAGAWAGGCWLLRWSGPLRDPLSRSVYDQWGPPSVWLRSSQAALGRTGHQLWRLCGSS